MPSRIIRDSYVTSPSLRHVSPGAEDRYPRYWLAADDFGCFIADPEFVRGELFASRIDMTVESVASDLDEYDAVGMVERWSVGGRRYGFFRSWCCHQRVRSEVGHRRKTPMPPSVVPFGSLVAYHAAEACGNLRQLAASPETANNSKKLPQVAASDTRNPTPVESVENPLVSYPETHLPQVAANLPQLAASDAVAAAVKKKTDVGCSPNPSRPPDPPAADLVPAPEPSAPDPRSTPDDRPGAPTLPFSGFQAPEPQPPAKPAPRSPGARRRPDPAANGARQEIFDHWVITMGKNARAVFDHKRQAVVDRALKSYSVADCKLAITGCRASAWHMGDNDSRTRYDDLALILRDAAKIERFIELAEEHRKKAETRAGPPRVSSDGAVGVAQVLKRTLERLPERKLPPPDTTCSHCGKVLGTGAAELPGGRWVCIATCLLAATVEART